MRCGEQNFGVQKAASQPFATPEACKWTTESGVPVTFKRYFAAAALDV
jgi:hypothetical protein